MSEGSVFIFRYRSTINPSVWCVKTFTNVVEATEEYMNWTQSQKQLWVEIRSLLATSSSGENL